MNCNELLEYVAALALFDGYFDLRKRREHIVIADASYEFLYGICENLTRCGISCNVKPDKRSKMYRLRIYGKERVLSLRQIAEKLLEEPNHIFLAASFDAEGTVTKGRGQPLRLRIIQKEGPKADAIRRALEKLEIPHLVVRRKGGYLEFVISSKENVFKFLSYVPVKHPKVRRIFS